MAVSMGMNGSGDAAAAVEANLLAWVDIIGAFEGARVERAGHAARWTSPTQLPLFNGIIGSPDNSGKEDHLERLGWRFHRIWSTEWFRHHEREIDRAVAAYHEAIRMPMARYCPPAGGARGSGGDRVRRGGRRHTL